MSGARMRNLEGLLSVMPVSPVHFDALEFRALLLGLRFRSGGSSEFELPLDGGLHDVLQKGGGAADAILFSIRRYWQS